GLLELELARPAAEQDLVDHARDPTVERDPLRAERVDRFGREAGGRLADDTTEIDAGHDRLDVDGAGDVVDRDLLDDAHEVDLGDDVLGDLLHDDGDERGRLRLVAGLLAARELVPVPQRVLDRAQGRLHDGRARDRAPDTR